jgi:hypothetical protein
MGDVDYGEERVIETIKHDGRVYFCSYENGKRPPKPAFKTRDGHELPAEVLAKYGIAYPDAQPEAVK